MRQTAPGTTTPVDLQGDDDAHGRGDRPDHQHLGKRMAARTVEERTRAT
jgi:hypothetical protein